MGVKDTMNCTISTILRIILIVLIGLAIYAFATTYAEKTWDVEYPMTNQKIEWRKP
jgi:hypothetical protein